MRAVDVGDPLCKFTLGYPALPPSYHRVTYNVVTSPSRQINKDMHHSLGISIVWMDSAMAQEQEAAEMDDSKNNSTWKLFVW